MTKRLQQPLWRILQTANDNRKTCELKITNTMSPNLPSKHGNTERKENVAVTLTQMETTQKAAVNMLDQTTPLITKRVQTYTRHRRLRVTVTLQHATKRKTNLVSVVQDVEEAWHMKPSGRPCGNWWATQVSSRDSHFEVTGSSPAHIKRHSWTMEAKRKGKDALKASRKFHKETNIENESKRALKGYQYDKCIILTLTRLRKAR